MPSVFDTEGTARESLREIVTDYGVAALDDERLITSLLTDLLAGHPREATLIRAAARARVAELLRTHAGNRIPVGTAIEAVTARLGDEGLIEASAARWIVTEYAIALGQRPNDRPADRSDDRPDDAVSARIPAQGVARVVAPDPAPTVYDPSPISDPRPVSGSPIAAPPPAPPTMADIPRATHRPAASPPPATSPPSAAEPTFTRPPLLATILALVLPLALGITSIVGFTSLLVPNTYADLVNDQWVMVLLPMTLALVAVTAAMRSAWRGWLATAGYAAGVYLATAAFPMIADTGSGDSLFRDLHLTSLRLSISGTDSSDDLWLLFVSITLTTLTHAVMKRLGLVRRVGLLAYVLTPVIVLGTNAVGFAGYAYVFRALHGLNNSDVTSGLLGVALAAYLPCVVAIGLAFIPRVAGRR